MSKERDQAATKAFRDVTRALEAAGWKVTTRAASPGGMAYFITPAGRESTISFQHYSSRSWRWSIDCLSMRKRGTYVMAHPSKPPHGHYSSTELSIAPSEIEVVAAWLPGWMLAREAGEPLPQLPVPWDRRMGEDEGTVYPGAYAWTVAGRAAEKGDG